ncbi:MAG: XRE family transcriptional regulator [Elusimicrobiota bacterium]|jgi:transcriptional regulator with XRE-family HTH domain|nr:XRE family transcriptional regulator [Elusimicrobiota bacterium]
MNVGEKIKALLKEHGWTQIELAKKLDISPKGGAIAKWIKGLMSPSTANKKKLAEVFNKSLDYFEDSGAGGNYSTLVMDRRGETQKSIEKLLESFPVIRPVAVSKEINAEYFDFYVYSQSLEFLPIMFEAKPASPFAFKVLSAKACPWANAGEYALFSPVQEDIAGNFEIETGAIALVKVEGRHTIKKFYKEKDRLALADIHGKRKTYPAGEVEVIARFLGCYRKV